jgi:type IV pilus assembly protein PilY1
MNTNARSMMSWLRNRRWPVLAGLAVVSAIVIGAGVSTAPTIQAVNLSADPLYAASTADKPTIALALSVEFPTVGALYVKTPNTTTDDSYSIAGPNGYGYLGYYDTESCYAYNDSPAETPVSPQTASDYKRFDRIGPADNRTCADAFSGNFLNWVSSSSVDILRLALSGGDRFVDTSSLTIVQRAVIPNGDASSKCLMNSTNFPEKQLLRSPGGGLPAYFGAVPLALQSAATAAGNKDIWVANTLNRILFGTPGDITATQANDCSSAATSKFTMGAATPGVTAGAYATISQSLPTDATSTACASQGGTCSVTGLTEVWYGSSSTYRVTITSSNIACTNTQFGVSYGGSAKCYTRPILSSDNYFFARAQVCNTLAYPWSATTAYAVNDVRSYNGVNYYRKVAGTTATTPSADSVNWGNATTIAAAWVGGTTYAVGDIRSSGINAQNYIRKVAGAGTTDPASDTSNWALLNATNTLQDIRDPGIFVNNVGGLCQQYNNGNYKPVGAIQKYSDQLRIAAMSYVIESPHVGSPGSGRQGGVLRAPMKYVGPIAYDINGLSTGTNTNAEWNANTGVLNPNPDNDSTYGKSGVINYLNQFGRTSTTAGALITEGHYKYYDPLGELYNDTLRYLQGMQPMVSTSTITTTNEDGFPITKTWTDPYGGGRTTTTDYSCLRSNIVVIGDNNTAEPTRMATVDLTNNIPDFTYTTGWTKTVYDFENKTSGATYIDGQGVSRPVKNPNTANGSMPNRPIIGMAYWAHTHDIRPSKTWNSSGTTVTLSTTAAALARPGLRVKTFTFDVNEFAQQNVDSTRRTTDQMFMASKYGGFESAANVDKNPYNTKGNPFYEDDNATANNNVWQDFPAPPTNTARRGSDGSLGEANTYYLNSGNAKDVLSAFTEIFKRAGAAARSIAGSAIQNKNLVQTGDTVYQGTFDTSDWSGDMLATPINVSGTSTVSINNSINTWSASARMAAASSPATTRDIIAGLAPSGSTGFTAVPFTSTGIAGSSLVTDLSKLTPASSADGLATDRLNYLRGDRTKEGNPFRPRNKLLGDIINSAVAYSGTPTLSVTSTSYTAFYSAISGRTPAVFVGANDGMLHGFNATTGDELLAYIPSWMGPKLSALTDPSYNNNHQVYVDGPPQVAEAQVANAGAASDWKTVLVSGTGGGGRGVFALDVTNPSSFTASNVMWEFTHNDDPDMGYVMGKPLIVKVRTSAANATPVYRWFAVVPSGVNSYVAKNSSNLYGDGSPAIFLLALDKPSATAWSLGANYFKVNLPLDGTLAATLAPGVVNVSQVPNLSDGALGQLYLGDLHGNVWKLDFTPWGTADWTMGKLSPFLNGTTPIPLFIAKDGSGNRQPITMAPAVIAGPKVGTRYVYVATGKYMELTDKSSTGTQSMYTLFDNGSATADNASPTAIINARDRLQAGTVTASGSGYTVTTPAFKWGRPLTVADISQRSGWYADFVNSGEREIGNAKVVGSTVIFGSLIPGSSSAGAACVAGGGGGNEYRIDIDTGNGSATASTVGIMGEPLVAQLTYNITTSTDSTGRRMKTTYTQVIQQGSGGLAVGSLQPVTAVSGRLSWRQINNYQDLKNAP